MKILKVTYVLSSIIGIFLLIVGIFMKLGNIESHGWFFTKKGNLTNGVLDANGTLILAVIILLFSIWNKRMYMQEKQNHDRLKNIEKNENMLRGKYNIFKIRKINKK
ncbi:hypothetical protein ACM55K_16230 [Flavobacterium sp. LT1R49]|uniref:hypothetical protein n=1 Tax=Flavobacterium arabinosi TaxID=3398737 RepID=UPI003A8BBA4E